MVPERFRERRGIMGRHWRRLGEEISRSKGFWEGGRRMGASGTAGGSGFALGVWLLGKLGLGDVKGSRFQDNESH